MFLLWKQIVSIISAIVKQPYYQQDRCKKSRFKPSKIKESVGFKAKK